MWAVLEQLSVSAPKLLVSVIGIFVGMLLLSLAISLRDADAHERPEIIRALAELMSFWRRR